MKRQYSALLRFFVGISIVLVLLKNVGFSTIFTTLSSMNIWLVISAFVLYAVGVWLGSTNVWLLIRAIGNKLAYVKLFKDYMRAWSLGLFLPGKVGDVSIVYFLKKDGIPLGEAAAVSIADKFTTATTLFLFVFFGFLLSFLSFLSLPNDLINAIKIVAAVAARRRNTGAGRTHTGGSSTVACFA